MKKLILVFSFLTFALCQSTWKYQPMDLVSIPTAGTLPKGHYCLENLFMDEGGILPKFSIGITDNFTMGFSFGMHNFVGSGDVVKNKDYPEIQIKYRIFDETDKIPAMVLGIDTQGRGRYYETFNDDGTDPDDTSDDFVSDLNRYDQKAIGLYFVISRNFEALGNFGIHAGINKNFTEGDDKDEDVNLFFGFDKALNRSFSLFAEYNFARDDDGFNDDDELIKRDGKGYLNAGVRWAISENFMLEVNINDLGKNDEIKDSHNRQLKVLYFKSF